MKVHKTLFVAPETLAEPHAAGAAGAARHRTAAAGPSSDLTRVRPAYVAALCGSLGVAASFVFTSGAAPAAYGPGPLTPPHVKAKLSCEKCHGKSAPDAPAFVKDARAACVGCHGPHPSTRPGHRELFDEKKLACVTCHTIHGPQSGVRFGDDGPAVRYSTWGELPVPEIDFHAGRTVFVPTIPVKVCAGCHDPNDKRDPMARCRSHAGGGDLEPTICFDEHRVALPPEPGAASTSTSRPRDKDDRDRDRRDRDRDKDARERERRDRDQRERESGRAQARTRPRDSSVCSDQHFEDRSFAWEAAREVVMRAPTVQRGAAQSSLGRVGLGAIAAALGFFGTHLGQRLRRRAKAPKPATTLPVAAAKKRLPVIDTATCLGCYACVDACPYGVLEVERYVANVARPEACCGLVLCEQRCPNGSLLVGDEDTLLDRPRLAPTLESRDVPGLFLAGDVTGVPLIKNAIIQGQRAIDHLVDGLGDRPNPEGAVDVCIVGAGPAGISAALRAKERKLSTAVLEQGSVAQSILNFPRGKLVFDQPLELPLTGKLWLKESTKEELLLHWTRIVRKEGLKVQERTRMTAVTRRPDGAFLVEGLTDEATPVRVVARTVVLSIGQRGSPRLLPVPIPEAAEANVHYHLADARSFAGARVIVVGLGDSAMEAAAALAAQPGTSVTILARAATYVRGQPRNISELERLRKARRLSLRFGVEVAEVHPGGLVVRPVDGRPVDGRPADGARSREGGAKERLPFDALFVLIGSIPPWEALQRAGVRSEKSANETSVAEVHEREPS